MFSRKNLLRLVLLLAVSGCSSGATDRTPPTESDAAEPDARLSDSERYFVAGMTAHHLCSGVFVVGRDYERDPAEVLRKDIARFPVFRWQEDFEYDVDLESKTATVSGPGIDARTARYNGDQGCTLLLPGESSVRFEPVAVPRNVPDPATSAWPTGERDATGPTPHEVDAEALTEALDWIMAEPQNTRAFVVLYEGKILAERYGEGFTRHTPQISWSAGKSITAALVGVLVERGHFTLDDPAPVELWHEEGDPRNAIEIQHLLRMSSGLDFQNYGLDNDNSWTTENEHFRIYFDALNVFEHAVDQPLEIPPGSQFRYRNSDPLTLGRIVRETVEAEGEDYLTFPQRALFDRIGARDFVLETDPFGNFILTGYDFGSALDWARFGLLHLQDGVWEDERILPEGWVDFVSTPAPGDPNRGYGGLFWLNRGGAMDRVPEDAFWASGFMGQQTVIIPSRDIVMVRLGPSPGGYSEYANEAYGRVLDAIDVPVPAPAP